MGTIGDPRAYGQFQAAESLAKAAANPGGAAGAGLGVGAGVALGQQIAHTLAHTPWAAAPPAPPAPPPPPSAAPPPVPPKHWFLAYGGTAHGPIAESALAAEAQAGHLTRDTLVWREGLSGWVRAGHVPEVAFALVPNPPSLAGA